MDAIRRIVHSLEIGSRAAEKSVGLSGAQLFVLQTLAGSDGGMSVNELAQKTFTHQSSVSVVVSRLVAAKLVKHARCVSDGRRVELTVTAAGRRALRSGFVTPQQRLLQALKKLPSGQLAMLRALLDEVVALGGMDGGASAPMFFERKRKAKQLSANKK